MTNLMIPVSPGELIDKISILKIKALQITDPGKRTYIDHELALLSNVRDQKITQCDEITAAEANLQEVNSQLWELEDRIRKFIRNCEFGDTFVQTAKDIAIENDKRARLKKHINVFLGSDIVEEKSYE